MHKITGFWNNLSVATKLYVVVGVMVTLISFELITLRFAMNQLSALRAFVAAEGMWSKAQKTSLISLQKYSVSHDEKDFQEFMGHLDVPLGDHQARLELVKEKPDEQKLREGFLKGQVHSDDIDDVVKIVRRFYWVSYLGDALKTWQEGDRLLSIYIDEAGALHDAVLQKAGPAIVAERMAAIEKRNAELTVLQDHFSYVLGEGSRWMEGLLIRTLLILVITIEGTSLFLTVTFARKLRKSLIELAEAAARVGRGMFNLRVPVRSKDEVGQLATSINLMAKELEENIGTRQLAEKANRTKSVFLANMSHEIRTPLTAILGFTEVLRDPKLSPAEREEFLDIVSRNGKALGHLINDILDLSKVEAGSLSVELIEFSLPNLVHDVVDLFKVKAQEKNISLNCNVDSTAKKAVRTDPTRLRQILTNLVGNAVKFTSAGEVLVEARVERKGNFENVVITVKDSGVGLKPEHTERLFKVFSQADESTTRKFGGTGLGLVLSRKLAENLGGTVLLKNSEFGKGSTFEVSIPNQIDEHIVMTAAEQEEAADLGKLKNLKVLVVEDAVDTRTLLSRILAKYGIQAELVSDGRTAVEKINRDKFDLILMDIQMPEMDGYETFKKIRETGNATPILALTAHALTDERHRILEFGFESHVSKPFSESSLLSAISKSKAQ